MIEPEAFLPYVSWVDYGHNVTHRKLKAETGIVKLVDEQGTKPVPYMPPLFNNVSELALSAFWCVQCGRVTTNVTYLGERYWSGWGKAAHRFTVRCHGETVQVNVLESDLRTATSISPFVTEVFQKASKELQGFGTARKPNVFFYCAECNQTSGSFIHQRTEIDYMHHFVVTCDGRKCAGKQRAFTVREADLKALDVWRSGTPIILPMSALTSQFVEAVQKAGSPDALLKSFIQEQPKGKVRKIRLE